MSEEVTSVQTDSISKYLFVKVGNDQVALPLKYIKEIIEICPITKVPMCSPIIYGVINVRGAIIPVIDLQSRLRNTIKTEVTKRSCIVLCELKGNVPDTPVMLGLFVSKVKHISELDMETFEGAPEFGLDIAKELVESMVLVDGLVVPILNMHKVTELEFIRKLLDNYQQQFFTNYYSASL